MKQLLWLLCPLLIGLNSCSEDTYNESEFVVGDIFTDSNIRVILIDTMHVETSTMRFDSIITSQSSRMLVGKYSDPIFGAVKSSCFLGLLPENYVIDSEAEYDSIIFFMKYDHYYYNDTLQSNTIHIRQLKESLRPSVGDDFYNTTRVEVLDGELGSISYHPRPSDTLALEIKLTDELGVALFEHIQDKSISNSDEFKAFFKGLALQPDAVDNGSVIGFSLAAGASYMRLYHSKAEADERIQNYIDFNFDATSSPKPFFNQISTQDPNDYLDLLTDKEMNLHSSDSENMSFIQSGIGIATRIEFPSIKTIYNVRGDGTLLNAALKIRPVTTTYNEHLYLRDTLSVFLVDQNNDITDQLYLNDLEPLRAILNRTNAEFDDIFYEIPLGAYIEKLLLADRDTGEALILFPADYNHSVDRFVLNGNDTSNKHVSLQITYAIYDENE